MSNKKFLTITYISFFFGICMVIGVFYIIFFFGNYKDTEKDLLHIVLLAFFFICILYFFIFVIWMNKAKQGKIYAKMYTEYKQKRIDNQAINEITGTYYYKTLPPYNAPKTFAINTPLFEPNRQVTINCKGVSLENTSGIVEHFFEWDNIKTIAISVAPEGRRIQWGYLYFSTKHIKSDRCITGYFEKPYIIMVKYSPKVIHCILQYWDKEIRNLEAMRNWRRYVKKITR
ncbi:MAG: hypothetical protein JXN65_03000 [Clostridia bacterium]|nr:hypothetical protein [Clostridia bacterium]